ncbi:carboxypeptidase-like regulatory domain-containing protein [Streptomyces misionensis]|uniref:carboxypeptidase-like regulatory domain-containing protein n=1 Tax=Streptomyces misionensis TaxID=67331 RepID=UPI00341AD381
MGPPDPGVHDRASGCVPVVPAGAGPSFDAGGGGTAGLTGSRGRVPGAHRARGPAFRGRPVPRALVTVLGPGGRQLVSTLTDARGEYAVTGLPEGYLSVVAAVPGRQPAVRQTLLGSGEVVRADFLLRDRPGAVPAGGPARD